MVLKHIDNRIRRAFSDAAAQYEALAGLQMEIGRELINRLPADGSLDRILDVGMGTGRMTNRLGLFQPDSMVVGIDIAEGMVRQAAGKYPHLKILQADAARLPFADRVFDAVISNLAYQWVADLSAACLDAGRVLRPGGVVCLTMFGQETLTELFQALNGTNTAGTIRQGTMRRLPARDQIRSALERAGLTVENIDSEIVRTHFADMFELLRWLKGIGANRLNQDVFIGRRNWAEVNEFYQKHFHGRWGVRATFEVIWVSARKTERNLNATT